MASPENPEEQPTIIQTTEEKKKTGCGQGCKYGLIAGGVILVLLVVVGGIGAMFGGTSTSTQPTDQATTVITTTQNQYTTKQTTILPTRSSQTLTDADNEFAAHVLASTEIMSPILEDIAVSAQVMDMNGMGEAGAKLRNAAIAANTYIEPLKVSPKFKESKDYYVLALKSYALSGNDCGNAADAYNDGYTSRTTAYLETALKYMQDGNTYTELARASLPAT